MYQNNPIIENNFNMEKIKKIFSIHQYFLYNEQASTLLILVLPMNDTKKNFHISCVTSIWYVYYCHQKGLTKPHIRIKNDYDFNQVLIQDIAINLITVQEASINICNYGPGLLFRKVLGPHGDMQITCLC